MNCCYGPLKCTPVSKPTAWQRWEGRLKAHFRQAAVYSRTIQPPPRCCSAVRLSTAPEPWGRYKPAGRKSLDYPQSYAGRKARELCMVGGRRSYCGCPSAARSSAASSCWVTVRMCHCTTGHGARGFQHRICAERYHHSSSGTEMPLHCTRCRGGSLVVEREISLKRLLNISWFALNSVCCCA